MICVHCSNPVPEGSRFCSSCGADLSDPGTSPRIGGNSASELQERLQAALAGRYDVIELLGRGGMGAVYLATDLALERPVAIKVLPPDVSHDENFVKRFEQEARTAAKLDHPNIMPIYAVEGKDDLHFFVMKFITGRSLDEVLEAGPVPVDLAQRVLWEAACALGHAHQRGFVHRDIKPANIMIDEDGRTMLTDFGISKALQSASQFTATGQVIGTPHYMSPEQAKGGEVDGRADQYSLAVVGYRMLAGRLPFTDDSVHTVIYKHVFEMPPALHQLRPDAPGFLVRAINTALSKDPNDRFPTMEAFATAVWPEHPVAGPSTPARISGRPGVSSMDQATEITGPPRRPTQPRRLSWMAAAALVLAAGAGGGWWYLTQASATGGGPTGSTTAAAETPTSPDDTVPAGAPAARESTTAGGGEPSDEAAQRPPARAQPPAAEPRDPVQRQPVVPQTGFLTLNAVPYATVVIDGVEIGDTPIANREVAVGRHIIEFRRDGYKTIIDTVWVRAGATVRVSKPLVPDTP